MSVAQVLESWSVPRGSRWSQPVEPEKDEKKQSSSRGSHGSQVPSASVNITTQPAEVSGPAALNGLQEWREGFKLLADKPAPEGWVVLAWDRLTRDAARFLSDWGAQADALGWTTADLFGCDPHAPRQRVDAMGLVLLLEGAVVEVMSAETATILRRSGNRTRFYRRPVASAVPVWLIKGN